MKKLSATTVFDVACNIAAFIADLVWKLWWSFVAFVFLCIVTLFISAKFADDDFDGGVYTDAMVPAMNDRIDHYFIVTFPWVLIVFLFLLVVYKRVFENER